MPELNNKNNLFPGLLASLLQNKVMQPSHFAFSVIILILFGFGSGVVESPTLQSTSIAVVACLEMCLMLNSSFD